MNKNRFYNDDKFLGSMSGRPLRIMSEYLGPLSTIQRNKIKDTIVFFGSARIKNKQDDSVNKYYQKAKSVMDVNSFKTRYQLDIAYNLLAQDNYEDALKTLKEIIDNENIGFREKNQAEELMAYTKQKMGI